MEIFVRTLQNQGTSVVVPVPAYFKKLGFNVGIKVDLWEENRNMVISIRNEKHQQVCPHCNGLRMCRCPDCAFNSGKTLIRRSILIAVKCQYCNGTGIKK